MKSVALATIQTQTPASDEQRTIPASLGAQSSHSKAALDLFKLYDEEITQDEESDLSLGGSADTQAAANLISEEVEEYAQIKINKMIDDPLEWWRDHKEKLPLHASVAREIFSIPAGSASVENNFSVAGLILSDRRKRLDPHKLESMLICRGNRDLYFDD